MNDPATQDPEEEVTDLEMAIDAAKDCIMSAALEHYLHQQGQGCDYSEYTEPCEVCGRISDLEKLIGREQLKLLALIYYQSRSELAELDSLRKLSQPPVSSFHSLNARFFAKHQRQIMHSTHGKPCVSAMKESPASRKIRRAFSHNMHYRTQWMQIDR